MTRWRGDGSGDVDNNSLASPCPARKFQNLPSATPSMLVGDKPELTFNPNLPLPPIDWEERNGEADDEESCHSVVL